MSAAALALAARDYWMEKVRAGTPVRLERDSGKTTDNQFAAELDPGLATRVAAATGGNPEALLVLGMAALTVLAERYTSASNPLLATTAPEGEAPVFFAVSLDQGTTPRALTGELSREYAVDYGDWTPPQCANTFTGWGLTVRNLNGEPEWLRRLEFHVEWLDDAKLVAHYSASSYPAVRARRLIRHYLAALRAVLDSPDRRLNEIEILDESDTRRLVHEYNCNQTSYPREAISTLFEEQARAHPEATAIFDCTEDGREWTYRELNRRANGIARVLVDRGVRSQELVPVVGDRGAPLVAGILAVLKAGGAYVPVDPELPPERIAAMIQDSGARFALAGAGCASACTGIDVIHLEAEICETDDAPTSLSNPESLAYVMYTSGSTGTPKGAMIPQRAVVRLVRNTNYIEFTPKDRILQTGSMAFDAATLEIWGALLNGGMLVLAPTADLLDPARLKALLHEYGITVIWLTATWFHQLADTDITIFAKLRHLLAGGEKLSPRHVNALRSAWPELKITNGYGPTENTTFTTCHAIDREYEEDIPIGRPVSNTSVFVVDEHGRLAPEGSAGELCTGGAGLGPGYWNASELTTQKYVSNPFIANDRIYRTGDRARWREDGTLDFLGRLDDQIKLRGFRIEPGEVESVLRRHPEVFQAAVAVRNDQLVAWIVPDRAGLADTALAFAKSQLPAWMVPARCISMDHLPLNRNGKTDRSALTLPDEGPDQGPAPRNAIEARIAAVWEEVLGHRRIGVRANFFELGGHSLKATALIAKLNRQAGLAISFRDLFRYPTIEAMARLAESQSARAVSSEIPAIPKAGRYALSPAQRRLWILDQLDPGNIAYNMPACFIVDGPIDIAALSRAVQLLVERHEILRTRFASRGGEPMQIVEEDAYELDVRDPGDEDLGGEMAREATRRFALDKLPLFRVTLFRLGPARYALAIHLHHIIGDAWSSTILLRELASLYDGTPLEPLRIQYRDAAAWQNAQLASGELAEHLEYWKSELRAPLPVLDLPQDFPRPPLQTLDGRTISFRFGGARTNAIERLRLRFGAQYSPFVVLLASVYTLLHRLSGQDDLIFAIPVAGRYHPDLQDQVGFHVNTLALRQKLTSEDAFGALLERVREKLAEAYDHQAYPFEELVDQLEIHRDISRGAVFDVCVAFQEQEHFELNLRGLRTEHFPIEEKVSKFDLSFYFSQAADGLVCAIEFNTSLFVSETIERFGSHLFALIDDLTSREDAAGATLAELELLDAAMYRRIMVDFNRTDRNYPAGETMISLFERQVAKTPDAVAVSFEAENISYAQLNTRANYIAGHLRNEHGVRRGDLVGVFRERTPETIAALIGVLKAGAAYVPADPAYPAARVKYLLEDSGARLVLTDRACAATAASLGFTTAILEELPGVDDVNPQLAAVPEDIAYIIYTSGSTGMPKGVAIEHRQAATFLQWCVEEFGDCFDVVFAGTSLCFDISIFELFYTTSIGKRVRLLRSGMGIGEWLTREEQIVVNTVPSVVKDLVAARADFSRVVMLNLPGEPIQLALIEQLQQSWPACPVRNLYGPSEDTTYTTSYLFPHRARRVLVGKAAANTDIYILDSRMRPAPIGVPGELYIAGAKVARGYLNKPELTREKFVANPFYPERPWPRMYRVQDMARWTSDGNIDCLGRTDDQVKIRGFRIELGEVEHALRKHPAVKDAAVVAGPDFLAAFFVGAHAVTPDELREFLGRTLPSFMIPARFAALAELPLTPNGKTDRKALRAIAADPMDERRSIAPPRDLVERKLAGLWEGVLERGAVSITDNFFDLGGHSLKATRLLARVAAEFGETMPLKVFFAAPTVAAQAEWYRSSQAARLEAIPAVQADATGTFALSPAQSRLWVLAQMNPQSTAYHMPGVFRIEGALDSARLASAFQTVATRHEALRTRFILVDGEPRQAIHPDAPRLEFSANEADALALIDRPFDLAREAPMRAALFQAAPETFELVFVLHHLAGDGWSLNLVVEEVLAAYAGAPPAPPLRIQYKDYSAWLNARIEAGELENERAWWRETLHAPLPLLDFPADFARPAMQSHAGAEVAFEIDGEVAARWREMCRTHRVTPVAGLLAAFQTLLFRYTGQQDIIVGTPASGRVHPDLERQVGLYVNTLALRGFPRAQSTFGELLHAAQQTTIDAAAHQVYPFDRLVDDLELPRDLSRSAVFDVMLVAEQERAEIVLPGLKIEEKRAGAVGNKFDLTLYVTETPGGLSCRFVYSTALYRRERMERMAVHFRNVLREASADPARTLAAIDILDPAERAHLLEWNRTAQVFPGETAIGRFERIAAEAPERPAVLCGGSNISYGELNRRANALAVWLRSERGVMPDDRVAVMLPADERLAEALLAIWKAGAVWVPVDPANPEARIRLILSDCDAGTVLTADDLPPGTDADEIPRLAPVPENAAYIIYTSGTTGIPKGALQPHRALVNYVCWLERALRIGQGERSGLISSYAFDLGYTSLWGTLLNGGTLAIPPRGITADPEGLIRWIVDNRLTYLKMTPSLFEMLMGTPAAGLFAASAVRLILLGGESPRLSDMRRFREIRPATRFVNHYGPTETTVGSIAGELSDFENEPVLGRPIDNTHIRITDAAGESVPVGVPGEIRIGGAGVGLGYWNGREPERFEDGFYRTGDLGGWTEDGRVRFLGRIDGQVKVRGYRVELREIEDTLRTLPGVKAAVVAETVDGSTEILAGVASAEPLQAEDLRAFLTTRLPDYMVPSRFVLVDRLPLTPNGKLDVQALRAAAATPLEARETLAPRDETEARIARIWCEVLRREMAGVRDNFFLSGGHSLRAASLLSRVYRETGVNVGLRDFFGTPTIEWLAQRVRDSGAASPREFIERIPDSDSYDVSPAQERLWLLHHIDPQAVAYSMPVGFILDGALDIARLRAALELVAVRQEALRTVFLAVDGRPRQRVLESCGTRLDEEYAGNLEAALRFQLEDAASAFDLTRGPLLRLHLLRLDDGRHVLLLNMHHIVSDGWSMGVLAAELLQAYGDPSGAGLPALENRYRDVAAWQRTATSGASRKYWLEQFRELPEPLHLPADRPRPAVQSFEGDRITFQFSGEWRRRVESLAQRGNATLFMVLTAGVQALLARYTGQNNICVGTATAGRSTPELEKLIGLFVQTLPLRAMVAPATSFLDFLASVKDVALGAFEHAGYPFDSLLGELRFERDLSRNPLFDVMVVLQNTEPLARQFAGIQATPLEPIRGTAKFDLNFVFTAEGDGIRLDLEYATALFDRDRMERLCGHLEMLLENAAEDPHRAIAELCLMRAEEENLFFANARGEDRPIDDASVLDRFENQVALTPDAPALEWAGGGLTFAQLNAQVNGVARALRQRAHLGADDLVALEIPRSHWFVIAMLGVWKTGAAWVPIDPSHPEERRRELATHARLSLTESDVREMASSLGAAVPHAPCRPESLAYVLFTSGSTGEPKGCMVEHRNIANYLDWACRTYPSGETRYSLHSPVTFDLTLTSLLMPLLRGECLRIYPADEPVDRMLLDTFDPAGPVNFAKLTPSHISMLRDLPLAETNVAVAVVGGETVTAANVGVLRGLNPRIRFINEYGPTEAAVGSMWYEAQNEESGPLSIGLPIQNTEILILDANLQPVPRGIPGEICIGGAGVARGYIGRPDLTEERFAPHPFRTGQRIYRTGDFGRWNVRGFEYLGRRDGQVKIRGHRIELGEIEARLCRCAGVRHAVADLRDGMLIAWVTGDGDESAWMQELARTLPDYMVPARIVRIAEIPITVHGKIDRKALVLPAIAEIECFDAPVTEQERILAGLWSTLLARERIGRDDNFFHLGGDSIRAVQLAYRLRDKGWTLDAPSLFAAPTLAEAAQRLQPLQRREPRSAKSDVLPLTPIQEWFFATQHESRNHFNQSVFLEPPADLDGNALEKALNLLVERHDALRLRFRDGRQRIARVEECERITIERIDAGRIAELQGSLDIERGPLLRAALIRDAGTAKLLIVIHHLAVDGFSWRILLEDLETAYEGGLLGPPTDSFGAWVEALRLQPEAVDEDVYDELPGAQSGDQRALNGQRAETRLTREETAILIGDAGRAYGTNPQDLLIAGLANAIHRWCGPRRLKIFVESHGRDTTEGFDLSRTVGWFTNRYPVAIDAGEAESGRLLKSVKEVLRTAARHGASYGRARPPYRSSGISFNYLGQFENPDGRKFRLLTEDSGPNYGPGIVLPQELGVVAVVASGELVVEITWAAGRWSHGEMAALMRDFMASVRRLIAHCVSTNAEPTPSDFTYKGLSLDEFEGLLDGD